jgi:hypothetical protein
MSRRLFASDLWRNRPDVSSCCSPAIRKATGGERRAPPRCRRHCLRMIQPGANSAMSALRNPIATPRRCWLSGAPAPAHELPSRKNGFRRSENRLASKRPPRPLRFPPRITSVGTIALHRVFACRKGRRAVLVGITGYRTDSKGSAGYGCLTSKGLSGGPLRQLWWSWEWWYPVLSFLTVPGPVGPLRQQST